MRRNAYNKRITRNVDGILEGAQVRAEAEGHGHLLDMIVSAIERSLEKKKDNITSEINKMIYIILQR